MALHIPNVWVQVADDMYSILKRTQLESVFHHISNLHQNIKFTMVEESNAEIAFLDTLLKENNGVISVLVYRNPTNIDKYLHNSAHNQTSYKFFPPYLISYSIITNKAHL